MGISKDSIQSHQKFISQQNITIDLLSDPDKSVLEAYGAWRLKKMYGKESWGVARSTVLIDPEGRIAKYWPKVAKAAGHALQVFADLKKLA